MDDNLVTVYSLIKAEQYKDDIESFAKTRVLSEQLKRLINQTFDDIEELFVIDSYERLYKDKSERESFKKQGRRKSEFGKEIVYTDRVSFPFIPTHPSHHFQNQFNKLA
jgi:hypothetical protein